MAKEKQAVKPTEQPTEPVQAQEKRVCDNPGSLYEGMELPRTRKEARERIETLLGVIRDETQVLADMIDPMGQMWARDIQGRIDNHLTEILLDVCIVSVD